MIVESLSTVVGVDGVRTKTTQVGGFRKKLAGLLGYMQGVKMLPERHSLGYMRYNIVARKVLV